MRGYTSVEEEETVNSSGTLTDLIFLIGTEEPRVMPLLNHNERDSWLIIDLQLHACLADCSQLMRQDVSKLALADSVAVENDARRLKPCRNVELNEKLLHHRRQFMNHLLPMLLDSHRGRVSAWMAVHTADHLQWVKVILVQ